MTTEGTAAEGSEATPRPGTAASRQLARVTGYAGLASIVLLFGPAFLAFPQEPAFDAPAAEILAYLQSSDSPRADFGRFVFTIGLVAVLWFIVGITSLLRRAEGEQPWRSTIAVVCGAVFITMQLATKPDAVPARSGDLDPQIAQAAFDQGNVTFANGWVALGSFLLCCGWVITSTSVISRWLGWWAVISGIGLILSRAVWTNQIWLLPYLLFWLWVIAVCVLLLRRRTIGDTQAPPRTVESPT